MTQTPKPGDRFLHSRQITRTSSPKSPGGSVPEECVVTAVRRGSVYFRNSTGFLSVVPLDRFYSSVKEMLVPDATDLATDLVAEAVKLVDELDAEYAEHGNSRRYHDLRDHLIGWADTSPAHAALVRDVIPV